jgi:hypothetical protein
MAPSASAIIDFPRMLGTGEPSMLMETVIVTSALTTLSPKVARPRTEAAPFFSTPGS